MPPNNTQEHPPSSLNVHNVLAALFKHKKKILFLAVIGFAAAAAFHFFSKPVYQSTATLLVRYVLDRSMVDQFDGTDAKSTRTNDTIIAAEVQILQSWDLAVQVAQALGPKRVLPDSVKEPTAAQAAATIAGGLSVITKKASNIISVTYQDAHPEVASLVLNELINRYFIKHLEVHRSAGAFDFVSEQSDQVRARLNQTEDALKNLRNKAGLIAIPQTVGALQQEISHMSEALNTAESELAEQRARVNDLVHTSPSATTATGVAAPAVSAPPSSASAVSQSPAPEQAASGVAASQTAAASSPSGDIAAPKPPAADVERYQGLVTRLAELRKQAFELGAKYTAANPLVQSNQEQIDSLESERKSLEKKHPTLTTAAPTKNGGIDLAAERAKLAGLEAKIAVLRLRLAQITEVAPHITELKRNQELEETNYKYFKGALEKA
ncbi:MAG: Wzz/FepE/Etk N-terminal domain-containing protein, partial [Gemmatimonadota bacterium]|nr:Wzz/FepE/Etk N-terminal domain-containing protein [Gemmatimonadota bacterium]